MKVYRSGKPEDTYHICKSIYSRLAGKNLLINISMGDLKYLNDQLRSPARLGFILQALDSTSPHQFLTTLEQHTAQIKATSSPSSNQDAIIKSTLLFFKQTLASTVEDTFSTLYCLFQCELELKKESHLKAQLQVFAFFCRNNQYYSTIKKMLSRLIQKNPQFQLQLKYCIQQLADKASDTVSTQNMKRQAIVIIALFTHLRLYEAYPKKNQSLLKALSKPLFSSIQHIPDVAMHHTIENLEVAKTLYAYDQIIRIPTKTVATMLRGLPLLQVLIEFKKIHILQSIINTAPSHGIMHPSGQQFYVIISQFSNAFLTRHTLIHELTHVAQEIAPSHWQDIKKDIFFSEINDFVKTLKPKTQKLFHHIQNLRNNDVYCERHYAAEIHAELYAILGCNPILLTSFKRDCPHTFNWFNQTNARVERVLKRETSVFKRASSPLFGPRSPSPLANSKENQNIKIHPSTVESPRKPLRVHNQSSVSLC